MGMLFLFNTSLFCFKPLLDNFKVSLQALPKELHSTLVLVDTGHKAKGCWKAKSSTLHLCCWIPAQGWNLKGKEIYSVPM